MTLGRLFTIVVAFLFITASCVLLAGNDAAECEDLKAKAQSAMEQAQENPAVPATPDQEKSDIPKLIESSSYVRINYVSKKMNAYYVGTHLIVIETLDLSDTVIKREVFDLQGRRRVQVLYETGRVTDEDCFDKNGKRITHKPYPLPGGTGGRGVYPP